jgi:sugar phosphate isomerase/epimerase
MHLGIFAKTFPRPTFEETLDAIADRGLTHVQFNMSCTGMPTLPERVDENHCIWIARSFRERGLTMAAISGTFNMCDLEASWLVDNLRRLEILAYACRWLDTRIITLCTGTRDPEDMWKWHPENLRKGTWDVLVASMREAVRIADRNEVTLAFEPEHNNVVNSVARARMLLDEIDSPWLKVVIDPANLMRVDDIPRMSEVLDEAFDWLGPDIVLAHAKNPPGVRSHEEMAPVLEYLRRIDPGRLSLLIGFSKLNQAGVLPEDMKEWLSVEIPSQLLVLDDFFTAYKRWLKNINYSGALIMHGMAEDEVAPLQAIIGLTDDSRKTGSE